MAAPTDHIPPDVLAALRRGNLIEAIKLLRSTGIGLREAKELIEAQLRAASAPPAPPTASDAGPVFPSGSMSTPPPSVAEAVRRGNKIEAIRLLRAHAGLGLKEAKDAVEAMERRMSPHRTGLSPGEVPPSSSALRWIIVLIVAGVAAYYFLRSGG